MPDITKCEPASCDKKETCYRYTATPSERQAYADFSTHPVFGKCAHFIDASQKRAAQQLINYAMQGIFRP